MNVMTDIQATIDLLKDATEKIHSDFLKLRYRFWKHPNGDVLWARRNRIVAARRNREFNEYHRFDTPPQNQW